MDPRLLLLIVLLCVMEANEPFHVPSLDQLEVEEEEEEEDDMPELA